MKKILFLETAQNNGGARKAVLQMAKSLQGYYDVTIVDMYGSCKPFVDSCEASGVPFKIFKHSDPHYLRSAGSFVEKVKSIVTFLPHIIRIGKELNTFIDKEGFQYVCVSTYRPLMYFLMYKPRAKVVYFAHGWYIRSQLNLLNRFFLKTRTDKIVAISQATKHALYNNGIAPLTKLCVVHNALALDTDSIDPMKIDHADGCIKILHCGGFTEGKGQRFSLDLAIELKRRKIPFKIIFAGIVYRGKSSDNFLKDLKQSVKTHGLEDDVLFVVNHDNVYDVIKACDVLIHPSETEGLPLVVMEAQYFKKPVIANGVGGVIDLISDRFTGFIPRHNSVKEYADIIEDLYENPHFCDHIVELAYNLINNCFSTEEQLRELINVFDDGETS